MQGLSRMIDTQTKVRYLNALMKAGFHTLDCGSFVSPQAVPQMADTAQVLEGIDMSLSGTRLLVIVANERGAEMAAAQEKVSYLGFPFSVSERFQQRNTNKSREEAYDLVKRMLEISEKAGKELVVYLSMGFGNPYGEEWNTDIVMHWVQRMNEAGVKIISLSDTIGSARPEDVATVFSAAISRFPDIEFGAHFHARPGMWMQKSAAAYDAGCRRFDGAVRGFGGCQFAEDTLVGNVPTEEMLAWFGRTEQTGVDMHAFSEALAMSPAVFG